MSTALKVILTFIVGALSLSAFGQTPQAPADSQTSAPAQVTRRDPSARLERLSHRLNLTQEQKTQIAPLLEDAARQARAIRQNTSLTPEQKQAELRQLHESSRAQVEALLTPEQVARIQKPRSRGAMAGMAEQLNLTADQKSKIEPLLRDTHEKVQAVRSDSGLTAQQKQEKIRGIRKTTHQQLLAVLTPEQQQQLKGMREHRRRHGQPDGSRPENSQPGNNQPDSTQPAAKPDPNS